MSFRTSTWPRTYLAGCLLLCGLATLASSQEPRAQDQGNKTYGKIEKKTYEFKEAGKEMEYALFVPSRYDKDKKTPLLVALHGLGGNPQQIMRSRGLTEQAEKYGYIVVAPMGYNSRGWYGVRGGGGFGKKNDDPPNLRELSEKDVLNVLEQVRKEFTIDEKRIYLMGHSMGGGGTWHLGTKYPDLWAGLAPIAPAAFGQPTRRQDQKRPRDRRAGRQGHAGQAGGDAAVGGEDERAGHDLRIPGNPRRRPRGRHLEGDGEDLRVLREAGQGEKQGELKRRREGVDAGWGGLSIILSWQKHQVGPLPPARPAYPQPIPPDLSTRASSFPQPLASSFSPAGCAEAYPSLCR